MGKAPEPRGHKEDLSAALQELFDAWAEGEKLTCAQAASLFVEGMAYGLLSSDARDVTEPLVKDWAGYGATHTPRIARC